MCNDCTEKYYDLVIPTKDFTDYSKVLSENKIMIPEQLDYIYETNKMDPELTIVEMESQYIDSITNILIKNNLSNFKVKIRK